MNIGFHLDNVNVWVIAVAYAFGTIQAKKAIRLCILLSTTQNSRQSSSFFFSNCVVIIDKHDECERERKKVVKIFIQRCKKEQIGRFKHTLHTIYIYTDCAHRNHLSYIQTHIFCFMHLMSLLKVIVLLLIFSTVRKLYQTIFSLLSN